MSSAATVRNRKRDKRQTLLMTLDTTGQISCKADHAPTTTTAQLCAARLSW